MKVISIYIPKFTFSVRNIMIGLVTATHLSGIPTLANAQMASPCCTACCTVKTTAYRRTGIYAEAFIQLEQGWGRIFNGSDGQYLGLAPLRLFLRDGVFPRDGTLSLYVERKGYQSTLRTFKIAKWYPSKGIATLNQYKYFISLQKADAFQQADEQADAPKDK